MCFGRKLCFLTFAKDPISLQAPRAGAAPEGAEAVHTPNTRKTWASVTLIHIVLTRGTCGH